MAQLNVSPEARALLLMAGGAENDDAITALAAADVNWGLLTAIAERENAFPVYWQRVARLAGSHVPKALAEQLRRRAMVAQFSLINQMRLLESTLAALNAAGIESMLLKGAGLAAGVYHSFVERPMGDVDLLVRPEKALAARDTLHRAGWTQQADPGLTDFYSGHHHLEPFFDARGSGASLELHIDILSPGHPFDLALDTWWDRHQTVTIGAETAWAPSPAHQLLHVCVHFAWSNNLSSSSWTAFRDTATLIRARRIDWDEFMRISIAARAQTCAYWTLYLAHELAGAAVPAEVLAGLRRARPRWLQALIVRNFLVGFAGSGLACPSTRVRRAIWEATIEPAASGHGNIRPWVRDHLFAGGKRSPERPGGWQLTAWRRYLAAVLRGPPAVRLLV